MSTEADRLGIARDCRELAARLHRLSCEAAPGRGGDMRTAAKALWCVVEASGVPLVDLHRPEHRDADAANVRTVMPPQPGPAAAPAPLASAAPPQGVPMGSPVAPAAAPPPLSAQGRHRARRKGNAVDEAMTRLRAFVETELSLKGPRKRPIDHHRAELAARAEVSRIRRELAPRVLSPLERAMGPPGGKNHQATAAARAASWRRRHRQAERLVREQAVEVVRLAAD